MSGVSRGSDGIPSNVANSDEEVARLTLAELNHQISWAKVRAMRTNDKSRAVIQQRISWLEAHRERLYGPAVKEAGQFPCRQVRRNPLNSLKGENISSN